MKKILLICFTLVLVSTCVTAENVIDDKKNPQFLYVISSESGWFDGEKLTLRGAPAVVYFSDRPARIAGHMTLKAFVEMWASEGDSFRPDPPNAVLSIYDKDGSNNVVVEVADPVLEVDTLVCAVRILQGELPKEFGESSMFMDAFHTAVNSQITD